MPTVTDAPTRDRALDPAGDPALDHAITAACTRIAPAWPLDRLIAVNPHWGWVSQPIAEAAATLAALSGACFHPSRAWVRGRLDAGELRLADLRRAVTVSDTTRTVAELLEALEREAPTVTPHPLITELRDAMHDRVHETTWRELALQSIGRAAEVWFDRDQSTWRPDPALDLYALWCEIARADAAPRVQLGLRGWAAAVDELPPTPRALIADALDTLGVPKAGREAYLTALLLSVQGWAAACAFRRWEARLAGSDDATIESLLAVRLAWELLLFRTATGTDLAGRWRQARTAWQGTAAAVRHEQEIDWLLLRAMELRYHERLAGALAAVPVGPAVRFGPDAPATTRAQAVFCIDVRSEVLRRHLEAIAPGVQTLGFAGFFGLPLAYAPPGAAPRPQLPGLLAPTLLAEDFGAAVGGARREAQDAADRAETWRGLSRGAVGAFPFVEATGLAALGALWRGDLARAPRAGDMARRGVGGADPAAPMLHRRLDGSPLTPADRAKIAEDVLRAMSLTEGFAPLVVFVGHGATVTNNPQAAGLACGACGGQSGEVNARALAALLNDVDVRAHLAVAGIVIPEATRFVGAVHDTVTDVVTGFPEPGISERHHALLDELLQSFRIAGERTRRERAARLGIGAGAGIHHLVETERRAADWSEVRPEWGLARNAALVAAPRTRTRPLDLAGRVFLHEYVWQRDAGFAVLETILTAPVIVAHWINLQYLASTVDPERYGSGDKTLHNVVAGRIGVFEGAGGDLRIGLARQSVHDGTQLVHEPLRLAVYLEAPEAPIETILARQPLVRQLVEHDWLHLYRIDAETRTVRRRRDGGWDPVAPSTAG